MAIDPAVFRAEEESLRVKFPDRDTPILARDRNGEVFAGNVSLVWLAMDTVCIEIETPNGQRRIFPGLGDEFRTEEAFRA